MPIEGVTVQKIIEPKLLGVFNAHNVYLCHGKYGEYFDITHLTTRSQHGLKWKI